MLQVRQLDVNRFFADGRVATRRKRELEKHPAGALKPKLSAILIECPSQLTSKEVTKLRVCKCVS